MLPNQTVPRFTVPAKQLDTGQVVCVQPVSAEPVPWENFQRDNKTHFIVLDKLPQDSLVWGWIVYVLKANGNEQLYLAN